MVWSLVTGGAGFIGSQLVRSLLQDGHQVRVLDNFSTGKRSNLHDKGSEIELIEGDIRDKAAVENAVQGMDYVFHQAAYVSVPGSMEEPEKCFEVNVAGTVTLLAAALAAGVTRVVQASSSAIYGNPARVPIDEDDEQGALSPYAASKRAMEIYGELYTQAFGLAVVSLRYFNVYGPRQSPASDYAAVIPLFIDRLANGEPPVIHGDGRQTRDFIFVEDVARANLTAAQSPVGPGTAFNICTGEGRTILHLLETLGELFPGPDPDPRYTGPRAGDIRHSVGSPRKAQTQLGFHAQTSFRAGLKKTVAWFRD